MSKTRPIEKIIIHCADTYDTMDIGVKWIREIHIKEKGYSDIGYHFVIRRNGVVEDGRPIDKAGAHCRGHNYDSIGICLAGGLECSFTEEQYKSLEILVKELVDLYDIPKQNIFGHRDFDKVKTCPNFEVSSWWKGCQDD